MEEPQLQSSFNYLIEGVPSTQKVGVNRLPRGRIEIQKALGEGTFGTIYQGVWGERKIALKKIDVGPCTKIFTGCILRSCIDSGKYDRSLTMGGLFVLTVLANSWITVLAHHPDLSSRLVLKAFQSYTLKDLGESTCMLS